MVRWFWSRARSRGSAARWRWNLLPLAQTRRSQRVADEVRACGRRAILVQADVTLIKQVQAMVSAVQEGLGPIDILINNAGMFPRVPSPITVAWAKLRALGEGARIASQRLWL